MKAAEAKGDDGIEGITTRFRNWKGKKNRILIVSDNILHLLMTAICK